MKRWKKKIANTECHEQWTQIKNVVNNVCIYSSKSRWNAKPDGETYSHIDLVLSEKLPTRISAVIFLVNTKDKVRRDKKIEECDHYNAENTLR